VIQVCAARIDASPGRTDEFLAESELARAERFRSPRQRTQYVASRACLREILGAILSVAPDALRLGTTSYGKPFLLDPPEPLEFNVSHADGVAVYAFSRSVPVGVDVERIVDDFEWESLARFLAPGERAAIASLSRVRQLEAFYCCWTRKEAIVKALGTGLTLSLQEFEVTVDPAMPARLVTPGALSESDRWSLFDLRPAAGFCGALAAAMPARIETRTWQS
jgi:4'-phosphopantetheinyl transferase